MQCNNIRCAIMIALPLAAMVAIVPATAQAETMYIQCGNWGTIAVDLSNNTVTDGAYRDIFPAQINQNAINWVIVNQYGKIHHNIDRTAGTLTVFGTFFKPTGNEDAGTSTYTCAAVSAPPTKF